MNLSIITTNENAHFLILVAIHFIDTVFCFMNQSHNNEVDRPFIDIHVIWHLHTCTVYIYNTRMPIGIKILDIC